MSKNQSPRPGEARVLAGGSEKKQIKEYLHTSIGMAVSPVKQVNPTKVGAGWQVSVSVSVCVCVRTHMGTLF